MAHQIHGEIMKAMILKKLGSISENKTPLKLVDLPGPVPGETEVLVRVSTCGVCHTELDEIEGRTKPLSLPVRTAKPSSNRCTMAMLIRRILLKICVPMGSNLSHSVYEPHPVNCGYCHHLEGKIS